METVSSVIKFVSETSPQDNPGIVSQTGDFLLPIILILLAVVCACAAYVFARKQASVGAHQAASTIASSKFKFLMFALSVVLLATSIFVFFANTNKAQADNNSIGVCASNEIKAHVQDSQVIIEDGFLQNDTPDDFYIRAINISKIADVDVADCNWSIKYSDQSIFQNTTGKETTYGENELKLPANSHITLQYATNMSAQDANKCIDKKAFSANFTVESKGGITVTNLKVDDTDGSQPINNTNPTISWDVNSTGSCSQAGYKLVVKDHAGNLVWDSGLVWSTDHFAKYAGQPLSSNTNYSVELSVYNNYKSFGAAANTSFKTGDLDSQTVTKDNFISYRDPKLDSADRQTSNFDINFDTIITKVTDSANNFAGAARLGFNAENNKDFYQAELSFSKKAAGESKVEYKLRRFLDGKAQDLQIEDLSAQVSADELADKLVHGRINVSTENGLSKIQTFFTSEDGKNFGASAFEPGKQVKLLKLAIKSDLSINRPAYLKNINVVDNAQNAKTVYTDRFQEGIVGFDFATTCKIEDVDGTKMLHYGIGSPGLVLEPMIESCEKDNLPVFRKAIKITKSVSSAKLTTAGLGVYEARINGQLTNVTNGKQDNYVLQPGFTEWYKRQYYTEWDVTNQLKNGENSITGTVGSGWWSGYVNSFYGKNDAFAARLVITYADGTQESIATDTSWKVDRASAVTYADIFGGESYDAAVSEDWTKPDFDDSKWVNAVVNTEFNGNLDPWHGNQITVREDLQRDAQSLIVYQGASGATDDAYGKINVVNQQKTGPITVLPGQTLLVDFGQNAAGWENFKVASAPGTKLTIKHSEILNDNNGEKSRYNDGPGGSAYLTNLRAAKASTNYIVGGNGEESYHPSFTFYGFQYVEITANNSFTINEIHADTVTSVEEDKASFEVSSNTEAGMEKANKINRLYANGKWGMYSNYISIPTDCPQRDERQGWTADAQVFSETACFLGNSESFLEKFAQDLIDSQAQNGAYPGTAPTGEYQGGAPGGDIEGLGDQWGGTGWADCGVIVPYTMYKMYGNTYVLNKSWDGMYKYVTQYLPSLNSESHHGPKNTWGDWLAPNDPEKGDINNRTGVRDALASLYFIWDAKMMIEMGNALERPASELAVLQNICEQETKWFMDKYYDSAAKRIDYVDDAEHNYNIGDVQTVLLYVFYLDLLPNDKEAVDNVKAQLKAAIEKQNGCLGTGFLGTKIVLDTLTKIGENKLAYDLLKQEGYPSWLYSVNQGATTIWERWNSYTKENGFGDAGMNSFNHYSYGSVNTWMYHTMAGINPDMTSMDTVGFKRVIMDPYPDKDLCKVVASYDSKYGKITVDSDYQDGVLWKYNFNAAMNGQLKLPKLFDNCTINGKNYKEVSLAEDNIQFKDEVDGKLVFEFNGGFQFNVLASGALIGNDAMNSTDASNLNDASNGAAVKND